MRILVTVALFSLLAVAGAWDEVFKSSECYPDESSYSGDPMDSIIETRMPMSMDNFIALLEKYEEQHNMHSPDRIALALVSRYRKDGMIYDPEHSAGKMFALKDEGDVDKWDIITKALSTSAYEVPEDTYEPREECALHYMMSHSTDTYPHPGIDELWEENSGRRYRRQAKLQSKSRSKRQFSSSQRFASLPIGTEPAKHPIENGVISTSYGPVALGTLLAGIASSISSNEQSISNVLGEGEVDYMPDEMAAKRLNPLYISTLAGDIGQAALKQSLLSTQSQTYLLGPSGMFSNSSAAPKIFTLREGFDLNFAYLTRAEIFAGMDAMLIENYLDTAASSKTKLSQVLRMYYSDHGLPNFPSHKACNRREAYKSISNDDKTKEQALNFMYAYADTDTLARTYVEENKNEFHEIEDNFGQELDDAWAAFEGFVGTYDSADYETCPLSSSNSIKCESMTDLIIVYNREGSTKDTQAAREYMTLLSLMIGVGPSRSRLGVVDARNAQWLMPLTNVSNMADLGANFTSDDRQFGSGGSSVEMFKILDTLQSYYFEFYNLTNSTAENSTAPSQVVVWNVPRNAPDFNDDDNLKVLREFRIQFPNVYFLLVGTNKESYENVLTDKEKDFFKVDTNDPEKTATEIATRVCQVPKMFVYPACNTDIEAFSNYNEGSHTFEGYISPNYTTYAMIAPHNFKFAYEMSLSVDSPDVLVCASREDMSVSTDAEDRDCRTSNDDDFEWTALCIDRNLTKCAPIYLSISGTPSGNPRCDDDECQFPNQIEYKIGHEGLLCDGCSISLSFLLLVIMALLQMILV